MRELRNAACEAAARGWYVTPLRPRAKQPATKHGLRDASDDLVVAFQRWEKMPQANIGLVCNPSGLVVLDVDPRHDGDETFARAEASLGSLPRTVSTVTGGGGAHYYFLNPGGSLRGVLGDGLDVRNHAYVLIPPSVHPSGAKYEWDEHPDEISIARLPENWLDIVQLSSKTIEKFSRAVDPQASPDPLRRILAATYITTLSGREPVRGYWQCPFHSAGAERTPSLSADGHIWACFGCGARDGKRCAGGNIYDFAGLLWDFALPLRGIDYMEVKGRLRRVFRV